MGNKELFYGDLTISYCNSEKEVNEWLVSHCKNVVGFSFELARAQQSAQDVPTPPEDIAFIQVVSGSACMVARVGWENGAPEKLKDLLTNADVIKVLCGVNAVGLRSLAKIGLDLANYIDLAEIDRKTSKSAPKKDLATLSNENFSVELGPRPTDTWPTDLTTKQKMWLALCPLLCLKIFENNEDRATSIVRKMALPCAMCDRVFSSTKSLDLHHQAHEENAARPQHICPVCQKHFRSPPALVQHMDVAHPSHPLPRPDTLDGNTHQYFCGECDAHFSAVAQLSKHQTQTGHQSQTWVCSCCNKRFGTRSALDMHYHVTHGSATSEKSVHLCDVCQRCFSSCDALYQHQLCVGHSMSEICLVCAASFRNRQELDAHFGDTKHGDYWLCCECPKKFLERDALAKHEASTGHKEGFRVMDVSADMAFKFRVPRRRETARQRREDEAEITPVRTADARRPWNNIQPVLTRTPVVDSLRYPLYAATLEPYIVEPTTYRQPIQCNAPVFSPSPIAVPMFEGAAQTQPPLYYRSNFGEFLVREPPHMSGLSSPVMAPLVPCQSSSNIPNISPTNSSSGSESVGYCDHGISPSAMTSTPPKPYRQDGQLQVPSPYTFYQPSTPPPAQQFVLHSHSRGPSTPEQGMNYYQFWTEATAPHIDSPSPGPRFWVLSPTTLFRCHQSVPPSPQYDLIKAMGRGSPAALQFDDATSHNPYPQ